jgi:hypothetical protein
MHRFGEMRTESHLAVGAIDDLPARTALRLLKGSS